MRYNPFNTNNYFACTLFKYLNANVETTPRPKTNKYGTNLKFTCGFFFNKNDIMLNFLSEYGGYFALKYNKLSKVTNI